MWQNCIPGDLFSPVRTFLFQNSAIYPFFHLKCITAQQIKENSFNFPLNSYVRLKYTACFVDIHRRRTYDESTSPYIWVIIKFIAYYGLAYIRGLTAAIC